MTEKTIVFKVGTSSLTQENGSLDRIKIARITNQLAQLHQKGYQIVLVTSGSIAAGFRRLGFDKRPTKIAEKQASAAVGQGLLIEEYTQNLMKDGIVSAQILLTQDDFADARRYQNASQALQVLLKQRAIPIINENDTIAIEEIKVGDNDTLSAQVASLLKADLLVLLTDVDGLYTANPNSDPNAKHLPEIKEITEDLFAMAAGAGSSNGTGGMTTKLQAAQIATKSGVPVFICSSKEDTALLQAVTQANHGTLFLADDHAMNQRKQWMAFYARTDAAVEVDAGAVDAMLHQGRSLLAAGVRALEGDFEVGQVVEVYSQADHCLIGKGRVKLSSKDLQDQLANGRAEGVLIHRNDWVSL
ncbi:TPA: glutamate 5-kinase [Streptococcus suis]|uniref:Glutamate 5-kinase n=1 Tax=Streptococcus suis TaxID=1307 RepID=A0A9X4MUM0_STRSU|nr:glutamate 5-kinase [Streptococcus suis]MDG4526501.1 glutamate 5-kinase [Streptococcus suis]MDG4528962.1 glutamate 5-kinase [Streptococcus suis]HEL1581245.1 glutamate 5-kinase [Streptococcus suis]HEL2729255.1 glutamate 5-kinase [Streptococcus suis]HEM5075179.1 glutamate 5-kinase [Streptococcus suis]